MSDSVQPLRRQPTRVRHPWDSPGKNTGVGCHFLLQCMKVKSESEVAQSCPTLSDPMDCGPPGSSVHGIFQARVGCHFHLDVDNGCFLNPGWGFLCCTAKTKQNIPQCPLHFLLLSFRFQNFSVHISGIFLWDSILPADIFKSSSDSHFAFLDFFFWGMVLIPVSCTMLWISINSSSGTLPIRSSLLNLFLTSTV